MNDEFIDEFQTFLRENDILHTLTAPGHPATNGLAERYVGEFIRINWARLEIQASLCKQN